MKFTICLTFLLFSLSTVNAQVTSKTEMKNEITSKHVSVEGTRLSIIPPAGWEKGANFSGFQHEETSSSILMVEIPGPFSEIRKAFTKDNLLSQGVVLDRMETIRFGDDDAVYISGEQSAYDLTFKKHIVAFGNEQESFIINGIYPVESANIMQDEVIGSLLSIAYDADKVIDPMNSVDFTVDVEGTKFKFGSVISRSLLFTTDGKVPTQSQDDASLMVASSMGKIAINDKKQFAINRIKKLPGAGDSEPKEINPISVDGLSGYEIILENNSDSDTDLPGLLYQVMLFTDGGYYMIVGTASEDFEENIRIFRSIVPSFKRK